ncbi:hypothetical protein PanWU01x14_117900 [Parasponia andersonii]|uniref:Uncharacterized protein n=1 Tax=Parasponia andersonii TaxID=3476 RepID=A0A2P5CW50_PARAD|nr:hypothetical protein PanWU01x14_117900 [Parasponia andersonii]
MAKLCRPIKWVYKVGPNCTQSTTHTRRVFRESPLTIDELQPWTKLEADSIRFLLCHRRVPAIDELDSIYSR